MAAHAVVQRRAARHEAFGLGIVGAMHQAHELAGDVAVEPRRTEGVLRHQPARREDREVHVAGAGCRWANAAPGRSTDPGGRS